MNKRQEQRFRNSPFSQFLGSLGLAIVLALVLMAEGQQIEKVEPRKLTPTRTAELDRELKLDIARKPPGGQPQAASENTRRQILDKHRSARKAGNNLRFRASLTKLLSHRINVRNVADPCKTPRIDAISALPPFEPGDEIIVNGCGFGDSPGELRLVSGDFPPPGYFKLELKQDVGDPWTHDAVIARLGPLKGIKDSPSAQLQVVTKEWKLSNVVPLGFQATREVLQLGWDDVALSCASSHTLHCGKSVDKPYRPEIHGATFAAYHGALRKDDLGWLYEGSDTAKVRLKNGWQLAGYGWWWWQQGRSHEAVVKEPAGFVEGAPSADVKMKWKCWNLGELMYRVDLWVIGPAGVPYR